MDIIFIICTVFNLDLHPCVALEHLMATIRCDEFDVQQEGVFCLEQACADEDLLHLLLVSSVYRPQLLPLARQLGRLLRSPSCDVPLSCMRIVGALTAAAKDMDKMNKQNGSSNCNTSSGGLMELVNLWVEAGITEALDDIQVRLYCLGHFFYFILFYVEALHHRTI